jgi:NADH:ubiquinone oxidoreductase subunit E
VPDDSNAPFVFTTVADLQQPPQERTDENILRLIRTIQDEALKATVRDMEYYAKKGEASAAKFEEVLKKHNDYFRGMYWTLFNGGAWL